MKRKMKIRKDDTVMVITGNSKGETGRILEVYPNTGRVLVEGINIRKKHTRPSQQNQQGGILSKEMPIHSSNVMIIDSEKIPTRIGFRQEENDGKKSWVRYAKSNNKKI
jgi:large subunit ribosomal protein L24